MQEELIGYVAVDSGTMYLGDPCYISSDKRLHSNKAWKTFCEEVLWTNQFRDNGNTGVDKHAAVVTDTAYGDGLYPVYATKTSEGRTASVTIVFTGEDEEQ